MCRNNILKLIALIYYFLFTLFNNKVDNKYNILYNSYKEKVTRVVTFCGRKVIENMKSKDDIFLTHFDIQTADHTTKAPALELKNGKVKFTVNAMIMLGSGLKSSILQGKQYYLYCTAISSERLDFSPSIHLEQIGYQLDKANIEEADGVVTCLDNQFVISIPEKLIKKHSVYNVDLLLSITDVDLWHDTDNQSAALEDYFFKTTIPILR